MLSLKVISSKIAQFSIRNNSEHLSDTILGLSTRIIMLIAVYSKMDSPIILLSHPSSHKLGEDRFKKHGVQVGFKF